MLWSSRPLFPNLHQCYDLDTEIDLRRITRFPLSICDVCGMPAGSAYPSGHLVSPPPFQDLRILQHLVRPVFWADWKTWHLYWRHFLVLWNHWKRNWMKLDRKQVLKLPLPIMCFEADRKTKITALADPSTKMAHCTQVPCKLNVPMLSVTVMEKNMTSSNVLLYPRP